MNVLHVVPAVAPRYGGPSVAATGMCAALEKAGARVLLATSDADGPGRLAVPHGCETRYESVRSVVFPRVFSESFKWAPALGRWLRANVASFDVVHVHAVFSYACLAGGRACRTAGRPYIVRPLGSLDPWSLRRHPGRKRVLLSLGVRRLLSRAAALHYTSGEEQRLAERAVTGLPAGVVVPLGVEDDLFESGDADRDPAAAPYVLSLSRLDPKKGIEALIESFHTLARAGEQRWRLVVAGDGPAQYAARLRQLAESGPACDRIELPGWVAGRERLSLFRGASLYVLPSLQENFGISVVEAMACGVPVLVSPGVNLASELDAAGAGWVAGSEPSALTSTLHAALSNAGERIRRGGNARAFAARFRWPAVAGQLLALYEDVCRAHVERRT